MAGADAGGRLSVVGAAMPTVPERAFEKIGLREPTFYRAAAAAEMAKNRAKRA
jgi:hypothetical protein